MAQDIIRFEQGIPGFEDHKTFALINMEEGTPFKLMQSVEDPDISLVVADPFFFHPEYEWELPEMVQEELGLESENDVQVLSVITVCSEVTKTTINLAAPLVINRVKKIGKQYILHDSSYGPRHLLVRVASQQGEG